MSRTASLRGRLQRQFLLIGVLPVLAVAAAAVMILSPMLEAQADARNRDLARTLRDQMQLQLMVRLRSASVLASQLAADAMSATRLTHVLQSLLQEDQFLQAAFVVGLDGRVVDAALRPESGRFITDVMGADLSRQTHFVSARQRGEPVWSDAFLSTLTGQVTAVLTVPAGLRSVVLELSLEGLSQSLSALAVDDGVRAIVLDRLGRVIAHPDPQQALRQESLAALPIVQRAGATAEGHERTRIDGVEYFGHAMQVPTVGWTVLALQPVDRVMAPLRHILGLLATLIAAVIATAGFMGWVYSRRTGREVVRLAEGAQAAAQDGAGNPALHFTTTEFNQVWTRLRDLFQQLHLRDQQTQAARGDLQAVLDAATEVAIIATDVEGLVTVFNIGAQRMLGRSAADVVGRITPMAWHDADEVAARADELSRKYGRRISGFEGLVSEARHGGYEVRDWTFLRADGGRIDVSLAVTSVRSPQGDLKGFLGVAVDVTERRRAVELELRRKAAELANRAKSDFLSRVSHELRTPLNAMLGYAQLMQVDHREPPSDAQRERLQHIQSAGWHLVQLIEDVLDLSRIDSGNIKVSLEAVDPLAVVRSAGELVATELKHRQVQLQLQGDVLGGSTELRVQADRTRLTQVLVNLLDNAGKYNRAGGLVTLRCDRHGGRLRISVEDTGRGMSDEQLQRLFQPFERLGLEGGAIPGTGIGLVITKRLVELMDGTLEVSSRLGVGSTFTLSLPLAAPSTSAAAVRVAPRNPEGSHGRKGLALYIEDNEVNGQLMRAVFRQRPELELALAPSAAEGLAAAQARQPDLILLDMHLPDGSGEDVMDGLASDPVLSRIPVLVVSADATGSQIATMRRRGARAYLTKPINVVEVLQAVDDALSQAVAGGSRGP